MKLISHDHNILFFLLFYYNKIISTIGGFQYNNKNFVVAELFCNPRSAVRQSQKVVPTLLLIYTFSLGRFY